MYVTVPEVRTSDDTLLEIEIMVFFELVDIDTLLQRSHDPIADMINAATADLIAFAAVLPFESFLEKTSVLNNVQSYPNLSQRAQSIGYRVNKVVYKGYHATAQLQSMHDEAIHARTRLRLETETEEQSQRLTDLKLKKEGERQRVKQEMAKAEIEHNNSLSRMQHEEKLAQEKSAHEMGTAAKRTINEEQVVFYKKLKELGVDLTQYLTAQYPKPDELIQVTTDNPSSNIHVHANKSK